MFKEKKDNRREVNVGTQTSLQVLLDCTKSGLVINMRNVCLSAHYSTSPSLVQG
jgi:hypothetical protein